MSSTVIFLTLTLLLSTSVIGQSPDPSSPAVLYLPLGGGGVNECEPAAGAKLIQLVPLMFAGERHGSSYYRYILIWPF